MCSTSRPCRWPLVAAIAAASLALPAPVAAQDAPRGFVGGLGGLTFVTVPGGAVAGQAGVHGAYGLFVTAEVGYMSNVLRGDVRDDIREIVQRISGLPVEADVSMPAAYGFGAIRWSVDRGRASPFIEGGVGLARMSLEIDEAEALGVVVDDRPRNEYLVTLGGGINTRVSSTVGVDVGYRYMYIDADNPRIHLSLIFAAVKVGF